MANWASTSYRIEGSKSDLERVFGVIDDFIKGRVASTREDATADWEGNIVKALGAMDEEIDNNYLRGFIQDYELDGDTIRIEAEEAWGATDFRHVLRKLMPKLAIYYIVEESGCEVYATNDVDGKYFTERFYVDACIDGDYRNEYYTNKEDAMKDIAEMLKKEQVSESEIEDFNKKHDGDDDYIYLHEYKITDC